MEAVDQRFRVLTLQSRLLRVYAGRFNNPAWAS